MSENVPINALFRHNFHARLYVYPIPGQQNGQPSQVIAVLMKQADTPWNYKILIAWLPLHCPFPPCQRLTRDLRIFLCVDRRAQGTLGTYPSKPAPSPKIVSAEFVIHSFMRVFPYITGGILTIIYPGYHLICLQHAIESGEHPLQTGNQFGIIKNHLTEIGDAIESPQLMVKSPIRNRWCFHQVPAPDPPGPSHLLATWWGVPQPHGRSTSPMPGYR